MVGYFAILNAQTGNVGINTPTPTNTLTVNGNQSIGSGYTGIAAPTNGMIIQGRTAIGTSTPFFGSVLELNGTGGKGLRMPHIALAVTTFWAPMSGSNFDAASQGMTVYNTNPDVIAGSYFYPAKGVGEYYWDGSGWVSKNSTVGAQNAEAYFTARRTPLDGAQNMPKDLWTLMKFTQLEVNKSSSFNNTTSIFTVPEKGAGLYQVNALYSTIPNAALRQKGKIGVFVNGFLYRTVAMGSAVPGESIMAEGSGIIPLQAGYTVDFRYLAEESDQNVIEVIIDFYQISR